MSGGCEWNPVDDRPAWDTDEHYRTTPAVLIVGANGQWRLCWDCARLLRFKWYRKRRRIRALEGK